MGAYSRELGVRPGELAAAQNSPDSPYILWQADGDPLTIEFGRLVLEQIRQTCFAATNGIQRGGKGVGGLLFGTRLGSLWRVLAWRPIECSHPRGEVFHLSGADEIQLESMLGEALPAGMNLLGWFASHPRGGLLLSPEERRIHDVFFSASDRLMLTMRATRSGELAVAVHAPGSEGDRFLRAHSPEIRIVPMSRIEVESAYLETSSRASAPSSASLPSQLPPAHSTYFAIGFSALLVITAALAVLAWQLSQTGLIPSPETLAARMSPPTRLLALHAGHVYSRLEVNWDPRAYEIADLAFAAVTFADDSAERSVELDSTALTLGHVTIDLDDSPQSVTLLIRASNGKAFKETVRLMAPPAPRDIASTPAASDPRTRQQKN